MHRFLFLALLLVAAATGCGESAPTFVEPPVLTADEEGELRLTLTPKYSTIALNDDADDDVRARVYMDSFAPATLQVSPGDTFRITLTNELRDEPTNLHFDGMNVSPLDSAEGAGDDVFLSVEPQETQEYEVPIPSWHPAGIFSWRAAPAGYTAGQVGNGMAGAVLVTGILDSFPQISGIQQRLFLLKDVQFAGDGSLLTPPDTMRETTLTVNGLEKPVLKAQPGEVQLWNIANASADLYYRLALANHTLYELARDGNLHTRLLLRDTILLPPSARVSVLVSAGEEDEYALSAQPLGNQPPGFEEFFPDGTDPVYSAGACGSAMLDNTAGCENSAAARCMGPQGPCLVGGTLATLRVKGDRVVSPQLPSEDQFPEVADLRDSRRCRRRVVNFQEGPAGRAFYINDKPFSPDRTDFQVRLDAGEECVEEWQINNCTGENHVFHIGQVDFQVIEAEGTPVPFTGYQDTVNVPFRDCDRFEGLDPECKVQEIDGEVWPIYGCPSGDDPTGRIVIRLPFATAALGRFTFQCAEAGHSDNGMMGTIEVCDDIFIPCTPEPTPAPSPTPTPTPNDGREPVTPGRPS